jgi:translocon-associated protein subunit alpha
MKLLTKSVFLIFIISLNLLFSPALVRSEDEADDVEDEDAVINEDAGSNDEVQTTTDTELDDEPSDLNQLSSPFVKTNILFVQPESSDLPAGRLVKLLVSFQNNGSSSFIVDSIDGSFRYPQDFSYFIQNFSTFEFNKVIESEREATFDYLFTPSETFSSRQFGLTINLRYRDIEGKQFVNAIFNDTINVVEPEEGLDGETFFLYIFLAAIVVLVSFGLYQFFSVFKKKGRSSNKSYASTASKLPNGTQNSGDVDFEWIPKEHLQTNKSPKVSPRQRKTKNGSALSASGNSSNDE